jgi:NADPH:quinone reductase-like Zn-dependent oxidoreductase
MKAVTHERFGIEAIELKDVEQPSIDADQVLVRVHAASVNPIEWYDVYAPPFVRAFTGQLRRPKDVRLGADVAGVVEAVGGDVSGFAVGDEVFGTAGGSFAEYAAARASRIAHKPPEVSFEDAAALPIAGLTALQALRDVGGLEQGQRVLINGASGGVGTYAVQLAKAMGGDVTAVCSTAKVDLTRELGADRVVDYTKEDFTDVGVEHDLMLDVAGSRSFLSCRKVLSPSATVVVVGAKMKMSVLGPLKHIAGSWLQSLGRGQRARFFVAKVGTEDLEVLAAHVRAGRLRSVIDRRYSLTDVADALRYLGEGHARGKIVIGV